MQIAALTVEIFARVLERCGVQVRGARLHDARLGRRRAGARVGRRRLSRTARPAERARAHRDQGAPTCRGGAPALALGLFLHDEMLKENIDGEALAWAHQRLLAAARAAAHPGRRVRRHADGRSDVRRQRLRLSRAIWWRSSRHRARSPVRLAAIGIGHDVSRFYRNATRIAKIEELGPALTAKLTGLLS